MMCISPQNDGIYPVSQTGTLSTMFTTSQNDKIHPVSKSVNVILAVLSILIMRLAIMTGVKIMRKNHILVRFTHCHLLITIFKPEKNCYQH